LKWDLSSTGLGKVQP